MSGSSSTSCPSCSQVRGRVIEVPVENNRPVKKGDVLFRIDPTPYESEVRSLEAQLVSDEAKVGAERARLSEAQARLPDAASGERQLNEQLNQATGQIAALQASLELARKRVAQNTELTAAGAGNRFDLETGADKRHRAHRADCRGARGRAGGQGKAVWPGRRGARECRGSQGADLHGAGAGAGGSGAGRHDARAARVTPAGIWTQTTVVAPADGTMVNVMLRPGYFVAGIAIQRGDDLR